MAVGRSFVHALISSCLPLYYLSLSLHGMCVGCEKRGWMCVRTSLVLGTCLFVPHIIALKMNTETRTAYC